MSSCQILVIKPYLEHPETRIGIWQPEIACSSLKTHSEMIRLDAIRALGNESPLKWIKSGYFTAVTAAA